MNILFLVRLYEPHVGGVEKHVRELSKVLGSRGQKIRIITTKHDKKLKDFEVMDGVEVYRMPSDDKWQVWKWMIQNIQLIKWADIVHIHDVFYWYLPFFWMKKSFITFHGYEGAEAPKLKAILWHRLAAALTKGNICIGDFHQKWYGVKPDFVSYGAV